MLGGSRLTALRRVVAPLLKRNLLGAWLLIFIPATRELSSAIFLYGPSTKVVSVMIFDMSEEGNFEYLAALGPDPAGADPADALDRPTRARARLHAEAHRDMSKLVLKNIGKTLRRLPRGRTTSPSTLQPGEFVSLLGPSGCGKTTTLAHDRRLHAADRRHDRDRRPGDLLAGRRRAAREARHVDDLPELRDLAEHDGRRRTSASAWRCASCRAPRSSAGSTASSRSSSWAPSRAAIRPSCRAASSSGSRWRAPSWSSPRCCCSTSRCPTSTPTCARRCASRSAACTTSSRSRRSTSRTTSPRRW